MKISIHGGLVPSPVLEGCSVVSLLLMMGADPMSDPGELHAARGLAPGDRFGTEVAALGDLDGDGVADWGVGAPNSSVGAPLAGQVRLFSGRDGRQLLILDGDSQSDRLGSSLAGIGDLDGDGKGDLLIGAPAGTPPAGSVEVRSGADGSLIRQLVGEAPGDQFGASVAAVGDLDGDGVSDIAVGAPHADRGGTNSGELSLFSGRDGSLLMRAAGQAWDQLGRSVSGAGDLNGDGVPDVAVGVPFSDVGAFNAGSVYVLCGSTGARLFTAHGAGIGDQLGFRVRGGVDVDLDGVPDVLCAAPGADDGSRIDAGAAQLFSGVDGASLFRAFGPQAGNYLAAVSFLGDVDGDGRPEVLAGIASAHDGASESGQVRVLSGADGHSLAVIGGHHGMDWFGASVAGLPDLDGDGLADWVAGAPGHDDHPERRGYVRVFGSRGPGSESDGER